MKNIVIPLFVTANIKSNFESNFIQINQNDPKRVEFTQKLPQKKPNCSVCNERLRKPHTHLLIF